jgi:hypothetical protein
MAKSALGRGFGARLYGVPNVFKPAAVFNVCLPTEFTHAFENSNLKV